MGDETMLEMAWIVAPLVGAVLAVSVLGSLAQTGVIFTAKPLEPDITRLNFFTRFFQTFSTNRLSVTLSAAWLRSSSWSL